MRRSVAFSRPESRWPASHFSLILTNPAAVTVMTPSVPEAAALLAAATLSAAADGGLAPVARPRPRGAARAEAGLCDNADCRWDDAGRCDSAASFSAAARSAAAHASVVAAALSAATVTAAAAVAALLAAFVAAARSATAAAAASSAALASAALASAVAAATLSKALALASATLSAASTLRAATAWLASALFWRLLRRLLPPPASGASRCASCASRDCRCRPCARAGVS